MEEQQAAKIMVLFLLTNLVGFCFVWAISLFLQSDDSSDEDLLHIDTEAKPGRNSKVKKESGSSAGILDLLQASKEVGGLEYNTNRYAPRDVFYSYT